VRSWGTHLSIGNLYGWAAEWAGLTMWGTGKLMGLAAYGEPTQPVPLSSSPDGYTIAGAPAADASALRHFVQLRSQLRKHFAQYNYPFSEGRTPDVMAHADFAASIQRALEQALLSLARMARDETGHTQLVLTGGVALNCAANGVLADAEMFDDIWVPPFPHDAGVSLGAALFAHHSSGEEPASKRLVHSLWAPSTVAPDPQTLGELKDCDMERHGVEELGGVVAEHLEQGRLVGWCQGRAEVGERALGARSILCDPRHRDAVVITNQAKGREPWRPLAPAVLAGHTAAVFDAPLSPLADFMLAASPVRSQARALLPAAVHVDGSARPQVVHPAQEAFHGVIDAFYQRTGVPAVINTSFNIAGEPIVLSAADAVSAFMRSGLQVLVLDDMVVVKRSGDPESLEPPPPAPTLRFTPWLSRASE
jgi:carbamoyltransferase